ncbi:hypothetical protein [uncultured Phyllobacterium sp.]|uniref:hypothetical protein n=1 Tax=uncultured Phyllobacterium sp. TaxID=253813 RepID=UPI00258A60F7|nr:hypothetical protein [uncultured Phyllobacterium sp.]
MKKIVLAGAHFVATGSAFAGNDRFGSAVKANAPIVNNSYTASIGDDKAATASVGKMAKADKPDIKATNKIQPQFQH